MKNLKLLALIFFALLQGCVQSGEDSITFNGITLSSALPSKVSTGASLNLTYSFDSSESSTTETFLLKAYSDSLCTASAPSALVVDQNPVSVSNGQVNYTNVKYNLLVNSNETIYFKVESPEGRVSSCTAGVKVLFSSFVLGQSDLISNVVQTIINATTFDGSEYKIHSDGHKFFVVDYANNRVLIWNSMPTSMLQPADVVLGQPNFASNTVNYGLLSASSLNNPGGVYSTGTRLFVADFGNNRVLIWNSIPTTNNQPADIVLGQPNMITNTAGTSALSMRNPWHIFVANNKLLVSDYDNHRILIWNNLSLSTGQPADVVVGQPDMITHAAGHTDRVLNYPYEVTSNGTNMIVADTGNNRIMIWNSIPTLDNTPADIVIGQPDMTSNSANHGGSTAADSLSYPTSVFTYNGKLFVSDSGNNRILIYDQLSNFVSATAVFGQTDFISNSGGVSESKINYTEGLYVDADRFIVGDSGNSRILIRSTDGL